MESVQSPRERSQSPPDTAHVPWARWVSPEVIGRPPRENSKSPEESGAFPGGNLWQIAFPSGIVARISAFPQKIPEVLIDRNQ